MSRPRIFVAIPSYRDRECQWTLRDMFERARYPERVFAGVCWQTVPEEDADCFLVRPRPAQVRAVHFHVRDAQGLGWARAQAQALWQGEEFVLQIDSHMRFADHWDERMLDMQAACGVPDAVLTVYPPAYTPPDRREGQDRPRVQKIEGFGPSGLLTFGAAPLPAGAVADRPIPTAALAGGFVFGPARMQHDVPSDPALYFNGEEPNLAVRLWTAGFDLFSPHEPVIWHYYVRRDGSRHWNDAPSRVAQQRHAQTLRRMRLLCEPDAFSPAEVATLGRCGLGRRRDLAQYEAFAGVSFAARTMADSARRFPWVRNAATRAAIALPETLRPAPGTELFVLGEDGVVFAAGTGVLHRLNQAAATIWCALEAGQGWNGIAAASAAARGIPVAEVLAELRELADHWRGEGLLADATPPADAPRLAAFDFSATTRHYRLLDTVVRLRCSTAEVAALLHGGLSHLEVPGEGASPAATLDVLRILDWHYIYDGSRLVLLADSARRLLPTVKAELLACAVRRHDHILHLHSAAVTLGGRLLLLPAASGSGKTTLTARLLAAGAGFFSDESVLLRRDGGVRPVPAALSVKAGGVALLAPHFPGLAALPEHDREDGVTVRYLPPPAANRVPPGRAARPALVVFPRHVPGAQVVPRRLTPVEALGRLLDECIAIPRKLDSEAVAVVIALLERVSCWELVTGDLDAAAMEVGRLLDAESGDPAAVGALVSPRSV